MRCLVIVLLAGCFTTTIDPSDLSAGQMTVNIDHSTVSAPDQFSLWLTKTGANPPTNAAKPEDCIELQPSLDATANQTAATARFLGGFDDGSAGFETNCEPPQLEFTLAPPPIVQFVLDDRSATLRIEIQRGADGLYAVTGCDFDACSIAQN